MKSPEQEYFFELLKLGKKNKNLQYENPEVFSRRLECLSKIETNGVLIDSKALQKQVHQLWNSMISNYRQPCRIFCMKMKKRQVKGFGILPPLPGW